MYRGFGSEDEQAVDREGIWTFVYLRPVDEMPAFLRVAVEYSRVMPDSISFMKASTCPERASISVVSPVEYV